MDSRKFLGPLLALTLGLGGGIGLASAQTAGALDTLSRPTVEPSTGLALARRQIAAGDLTQALATVERVILARPNDEEARLLHAGLLCRIDDRAGSVVEFDRLRGRDFAPELWREATAPCQAPRAGG
jgi:Tfp pilus assembly protein PilF